MIYILLSLLLIIFHQDLKERQVFLLVLLTAIVAGSFIYFKNTLLNIYLLNILINLIILSTILVIIFLYSKLKLKKSFFYSLGLGDILFFILLSVSFPTVTFLTLFSISLFFSLILFLTLKPKLNQKTVPLAGFQALFLFLILFINLVFDIVNIYAF